MAKAIPIPGYYSTSETMEFFGISKNTLKTWVTHGKINVMIDDNSSHRYYDIAECQELFNEIEKFEKSGEYIAEGELNNNHEFRGVTWARNRFTHEILPSYPHPIRGQYRYYKKSDIRKVMEKMPQAQFQFIHYSTEELIRKFRPTLEKLSDE